jgi:hypothetical protein
MPHPREPITAYLSTVRTMLQWSAVLSKEFRDSILESLREVGIAAYNTAAGQSVEIPTNKVIEDTVADWRRTAILSERFLLELIGHLHKVAEIAYKAGEAARAAPRA